MMQLNNEKSTLKSNDPDMLILLTDTKLRDGDLKMFFIASNCDEERVFDGYQIKINCISLKSPLN